MIEQYKDEMASVHVPTDLLARTKAAIRIEEEKVQNEKVQNEKVQNEKVQNEKITEAEVVSITSRVKTRKIFMSVATFAATVALFVGVSIFFMRNSTTSVGQRAGTESGVLMLETLADWETVEDLYKVQRLQDSETPDFDAAELKDFKDCTEVQRENYRYRAILSEEGAKIYVRKENHQMIFQFDSGNLDLILPLIDEYYTE